MGSYRESADIWVTLTRRYPNGDWMGKRLFKKSFWNNPYLFHDSFGKYWNKWIWCRLFGHNKVKNIADPGEPVKWHCFKCEQTVGKIDRLADR